MKKIDQLKGFSIKFGIICSIIVTGCAAVNAVIDTASKAFNAWSDVKEKVVPLETEGEPASEDSAENNGFGIFWWVIAGGGVVMFILCGKADKKHKKHLEETDRIENQHLTPE